MFDQGSLNALIECGDNNERCNLLQRFASYVLPNYDDVQSVYPEIRSALVLAVKQAREAPVRAIGTPFGVLSGRTAEDVLRLVANIIERLLYVDPEASLDIICELFSGADNDNERKPLLQLAERLAQYELSVWEKAGPRLQYLLVGTIRRFNKEKLALLRPVVMEVLRQVLRPDLRGTSSTYDKITLHVGAVVPTEMLASTRSSAIDVLKSLFLQSTSDAERLAIIHVLSEAAATPHQGSYGNALLKMVLDDAAKIVEFYVEIADDQSFELLQQLEENLLWLYRRNRGITSDPLIVAARTRVDEGILTFRDRINVSRDYTVYKTLVGYQSVFLPAWER